MAAPFGAEVQPVFRQFLRVLSGRLRLTAQHLPLEVQETKRVPEGAGVRPACLISYAIPQVDQALTSEAPGANAQTAGLYRILNSQFCVYLNSVLFEAVLRKAVEAGRDKFAAKDFSDQNRRAFSAIAG